MTTQPGHPNGLTTAEVADRIKRGQTNATRERTSRTLSEIIRANVVTRFNAILGTMLILILLTGATQDALFGLVLVLNALIGIIQEWRAKRTLDQLALLVEPQARVLRDGQVNAIRVEEIVLDDTCELRSGDQIPADGTVLQSDSLEVDESMLTGESDPVIKTPGETVLSGSIVVAGSGRFEVTQVGAEAYAHKLTAQAQQFKLVHSELMDGINRFLRLIQWAIIPTAILLALSQFRVQVTWQAALGGVVAGVVAMVPQGLVLLTSLAFAAAALKLARLRVLVQELPAVEGLARVDTVLLDKTGTITKGGIRFSNIEILDPDLPVKAALGALAAGQSPSALIAVLANAFPAPTDWPSRAQVPFSSARRFSAADFTDQGTWVLGAPEVIVPNSDGPVRKRTAKLAAEGRRVLVLAKTDAALTKKLPENLKAAALITFEEQIRPDAAETLRYFAEQGVDLKIISGDNPQTVAAVVGRAGFKGAHKAIDAKELPTDLAELADMLKTISVMGRVTPQQKRAIVAALQQSGHVVAMVGDGVNDALALKDADLGIAMGKAAPATRAVAQIILLDNQFSGLPKILGEGRRVTANIERVANLFLTKTVYAMALAVVIGIARWPYPFLARHLTVVDALAIGIPGFFIALGPNLRRYKPGFVNRVLRFSLPAGLIVATIILLAYAFARYIPLSLIESRTLALLALLISSLWVLNLLIRPITFVRALLFAIISGTCWLILETDPLKQWLALQLPQVNLVLPVIIITAIGAVALEAAWRLGRVGQV